MKRLMRAIVLVAGLLGGELSTVAWSAELKVIQTQKTKDAVVALKSESGKLAPGKNSFVLEFTSPSGQPLDVGKVALNASMSMPGMAPMVEGRRCLRIKPLAAMSGPSALRTGVRAK